MEVWEVEGTQASPWEIIDAHEIVHALIGRGCARSIAPCTTLLLFVNDAAYDADM